MGRVPDPGARHLPVGTTPFALRRGYKFEVNRLGKLATWLLYLSLALVMVVHGSWPLWIFWAGFGLAVASLVSTPQGAEGDRRGAGNIEISS